LSGLDEMDSRILGAVQSDFPVCERPFARIAETLGVDEDTVLERIISLKERGVIRRFGAVFDSRKLGYVSTLVGVRIPNPSDIPAVAREINRFAEVTHNYQRADEFNLWFTLIAASRKRIDQILAKVSGLAGVAEVRDLPAEEIYKIKVDFKPTGK